MVRVVWKSSIELAVAEIVKHDSSNGRPLDRWKSIGEGQHCSLYRWRPKYGCQLRNMTAKKTKKNFLAPSQTTPIGTLSISTVDDQGHRQWGHSHPQRRHPCQEPKPVQNKNRMLVMMQAATTWAQQCLSCCSKKYDNRGHGSIRFIGAQNHVLPKNPS